MTVVAADKGITTAGVKYRVKRVQQDIGLGG